MSKKRQMMGRAMMSCSTQGIKWEEGGEEFRGVVVVVLGSEHGEVQHVLL